MVPRQDGQGTDGAAEQGVDGLVVRNRTISRNTAPVIATPMRSQETTFIEASGSLTRRMTRSMAKAQFNPALSSTPGSATSGSATRLQERLRSASTKSRTQATSSKLEDSRSIRVGGGNQDEEDADLHDDDVYEKALTFVTQRPPAEPQQAKGRRPKGKQGNASNRLGSRKKAGKATTRDSTPSDTVTSAADDRYRLRKKRKLDVTPSRMPLRRSARLAKPLTVFHKYPYLPTELQMLIWEAAMTPRLVYLRNDFTQPPPPPAYPVVHNRPPPWFMACQLSQRVSLHHYRNMFGSVPRNNFAVRRFRHRVNINLEMDIIVFEPCCNGCRAKNCASRQFTDQDRALIRQLAVQTDSPYLMPTVQPCWASITDTWPNVNTIYLMRTAIKGDNPREKAMIRIEEGEHENNLRKRFSDWKKGDGKEKAIQTIEFVTVVDKESDSIPLKDRYKSVQNRKTNISEDIIIG